MKNRQKAQNQKFEIMKNSNLIWQNADSFGYVYVYCVLCTPEEVESISLIIKTLAEHLFKSLHLHVHISGTCHCFLYNCVLPMY